MVWHIPFCYIHVLSIGTIASSISKAEAALVLRAIKHQNIGGSRGDDKND